MGFKITKELANGLTVTNAYGRMEAVSGRKDGNIETL